MYHSAGAPPPGGGGQWAPMPPFGAAQGQGQPHPGMQADPAAAAMASSMMNSSMYAAMGAEDRDAARAAASEQAAAHRTTQDLDTEHMREVFASVPELSTDVRSWTAPQLNLWWKALGGWAVPYAAAWSGCFSSGRELLLMPSSEESFAALLPALDITNALHAVKFRSAFSGLHRFHVQMRRTAVAATHSPEAVLQAEFEKIRDKMDAAWNERQLGRIRNKQSSMQAAQQQHAAAASAHSAQGGSAAAAAAAAPASVVNEEIDSYMFPLEMREWTPLDVFKFLTTRAEGVLLPLVLHNIVRLQLDGEGLSAWTTSSRALELHRKEMQLLDRIATRAWAQLEKAIVEEQRELDVQHARALRRFAAQRKADEQLLSSHIAQAEIGEKALELIGTGAFGKVFKIRYQGRTCCQKKLTLQDGPAGSMNAQGAPAEAGEPISAKQDKQKHAHQKHPRVRWKDFLPVPVVTASAAQHQANLQQQQQQFQQNPQQQHQQQHQPPQQQQTRPAGDVYASAGAVGPRDPERRLPGLSGAEQLRHEALMLAKCQGNHVVRFLGLSDDASFYLTAFCAHDSLANEIKKARVGKGQLLNLNSPINRETQRLYNLADADVVVFQCVRLAREIAKGVDVIHSAGVIHCDLAPRNILLDAQLHVHVADFGLSERREDLDRLLEEEQRRVHLARTALKLNGPRPEAMIDSVREDMFAHSKHTALWPVLGRSLHRNSEKPWQHLAPRVLELHADGLQRYDERSDLYAVGAMMLEMVRLVPLHEGTTAEQNLEEKRLGRGVPDVPSNIHRAYAEIVNDLLNDHLPTSIASAAVLEARLASLWKSFILQASLGVNEKVSSAAAAGGGFYSAQPPASFGILPKMQVNVAPAPAQDAYARAGASIAAPPADTYASAPSPASESAYASASGTYASSPAPYDAYARAGPAPSLGGRSAAPSSAAAAFNIGPDGTCFSASDRPSSGSTFDRSPLSDDALARLRALGPVLRVALSQRRDELTSLGICVPGNCTLNGEEEMACSGPDGEISAQVRNVLERLQAHLLPPDPALLSSMLLLHEWLSSDVLRDLLHAAYESLADNQQEAVGSLSQALELVWLVLHVAHGRQGENGITVAALSYIQCILERDVTSSFTSDPLVRALQADVFCFLLLCLSQQDAHIDVVSRACLLLKSATRLSQRGTALMEMEGVLPRLLRAIRAVSVQCQQAGAANWSTHSSSSIQALASALGVFSASSVLAADVHLSRDVPIARMLFDLLHASCELAPVLSATSPTSGLYHSGAANASEDEDVGASEETRAWMSSWPFYEMPQCRVVDKAVATSVLQLLFDLCENEESEERMRALLGTVILRLDVQLLLSLVRFGLELRKQDRAASFALLNPLMGVLDFLTQPTMDPSGALLHSVLLCQDVLGITMAVQTEFLLVSASTTELDLAKPTSWHEAALSTADTHTYHARRELPTAHGSILATAHLGQEGVEADDAAMRKQGMHADRLQQSCASLLSHLCCRREVQDLLYQSRASELVCRALDTFAEHAGVTEQCLLTLARLTQGHHLAQRNILRSHLMHYVYDAVESFLEMERPSFLWSATLALQAFTSVDLVAQTRFAQKARTMLDGSRSIANTASHHQTAAAASLQQASAASRQLSPGAAASYEPDFLAVSKQLSRALLFDRFSFLTMLIACASLKAACISRADMGAVHARLASALFRLLLNLVCVNWHRTLEALSFVYTDGRGVGKKLKEMLAEKENNSEYYNGTVADVVAEKDTKPSDIAFISPPLLKLLNILAATHIASRDVAADALQLKHEIATANQNKHQPYWIPHPLKPRIVGVSITCSPSLVWEGRRTAKEILTAIRTHPSSTLVVRHACILIFALLNVCPPTAQQLEAMGVLPQQQQQHQLQQQQPQAYHPSLQHQGSQPLFQQQLQRSGQLLQQAVNSILRPFQPFQQQRAPPQQNFQQWPQQQQQPYPQQHFQQQPPPQQYQQPQQFQQPAPAAPVTAVWDLGYVYHEMTREVASALSVNDGIELLVDVLTKHPFDRALQSSVILTMLVLMQGDHLRRRSKETLLRLREVALLAFARPSSLYLPNSGDARRYRIRLPAFRLLYALDEMLNGDVNVARPSRAEVLGTEKRMDASEGSKKDFFDVRITWDNALQWRIARRYVHIQRLHREMSALLPDVPPMPHKGLFFKAATFVQPFRHLFDYLVEQPAARNSQQFLTFIEAAQNGALAQNRADRVRQPKLALTLPTIPEHRVDAVVLAEEDALLFVACSQRSFLGSVGALLVYRTDGANPQHTVKIGELRFSCAVTRLQYDSSERKCLCVGLSNGKIALFSIVGASAAAEGSQFTMQHMHTIKWHEGEITGMHYDASQQILISVSDDGAISSFSLSEGCLVAQAKHGSKNAFCSLAYDPQTRWAVAGTRQSLLFVLDVNSASCPLHTLHITQFVQQQQNDRAIRRTGKAQPKMPHTGGLRSPTSPQGSPASPGASEPVASTDMTRRERADEDAAIVCNHVAFLKHIDQTRLIVQCGTMTLAFKLPLPGTHTQQAPSNYFGQAQILSKSRSHLHAAAFCSIRQTMMTGSSTGAICMSEVTPMRPSQLRYAWRVCEEGVTSMSFARLSCWLAYGTDEGRVHIVDMGELPGHSNIRQVHAEGQEQRKKLQAQLAAAAQAQQLEERPPQMPLGQGAAAGAGAASPSSPGGVAWAAAPSSPMQAQHAAKAREASANSHPFGWVAQGKVVPIPLVSSSVRPSGEVGRISLHDPRVLSCHVLLRGEVVKSGGILVGARRRHLVLTRSGLLLWYEETNSTEPQDECDLRATGAIAVQDDISKHDNQKLPDFCVGFTVQLGMQRGSEGAANSNVFRSAGQSHFFFVQSPQQREQWLAAIASVCQ